MKEWMECSRTAMAAELGRNKSPGGGVQAVVFLVSPVSNPYSLEVSETRLSPATHGGQGSGACWSDSS